MDKRPKFVAVGTVTNPYLIIRDTVEGIDEAVVSLCEEIPFTVYDYDGHVVRAPVGTEYPEPIEYPPTEDERRFYAHAASVLAAQASILAAKAAEKDIDLGRKKCNSFWCWF